MPDIHAWKQRRFIHRKGEQVAWYRALKADDYNPRTNHVDRNSSLSQTREFGHIYLPQSLPAPSAAPSVAIIGMGDVPAGINAYAYSIATAYGETSLSPLATVTVTSPSEIGIGDLFLPETLAGTTLHLYRARCNAQGTVMTDYHRVGSLEAGEDSLLDNFSLAEWRLGEVHGGENTTYPRVLIQDFRTQMEVIGGDGIPSMMQIGNARIATMPDECPLQRPDKIVLIERTDSSREVIERGSTGSGDAAIDWVPHTQLVGVADVVQLAAGNIVYREGVDFQISADNRGLEWFQGLGPQHGEQYSIEYSYRPTMWFLNEQKYIARPANSASEEGEFLAMRSGRIIVKHPEDLTPA